MLTGKPFVEDLLEPLTNFCADHPLVAHNASFDSQFLVSDYKKFEVPAPKGIVLDTLPIARKVFPGLANYKLGTLVQHLKIPSSEFHRAEADASYCGFLFLEMIRRVSIHGKSPEIANLVALTGRPQFSFPLIQKVPKQLDFLF